MTNEAIKQFDIWGWLTENEQKILLLAGSLKAVPKDKLLFRKGEKCDHVGLLLAGKLLLVHPVAGHEDMVMDIVRPGGLFAEALLMAASPIYEYQIEAYEDSIVVFIPLPIFSGIAQQNQRIASHLYELAVERTRRTERRLLDVRYQSVEYRIRQLLRELIEADGKLLMNGEINLTMRLKHTLVAQLCSTSRQSVTIILNELKKKGIIRYNRRYMVVRQPGAL